METTKLPGTDMEPSRIGLGSWAIGGWMWGGTEERASIDTIRAAIDKGITLIDTAPVYGQGTSEELVGKALGGGLRDKVLIATKVCLNWTADGQPFRDGRKERVMQEVHGSLTRLDTDVIDLYQVHWPDPQTPIEETAEAMKTLLDDGKIRAVGVSNFSPRQMDRFHAVCPLTTNQPPYNLFERGIDDDVLPQCRDKGLATLTYGALCRGLLTGKMGPGHRFAGDDLRNIDPKFQGQRFRQYIAAVDKLDDYARERFDKRVIHLALRWLLDRDGVSVALWGARKPDQLDPVSEVWGWHLDDDAKADIDRIINDTVTDPVGPEFMAPPDRAQVATEQGTTDTAKPDEGYYA